MIKDLTREPHSAVLKGSRIADFEWSDDSDSIVLMTISRKPGAGPGPGAFEWQSI